MTHCDMTLPRMQHAPVTGVEQVVFVQTLPLPRHWPFCATHNCSDVTLHCRAPDGELMQHAPLDAGCALTVFVHAPIAVRQQIAAAVPAVTRRTNVLHDIAMPPVLLLSPAPSAV
jgi:hypothetical protein